MYYVDILTLNNLFVLPLVLGMVFSVGTAFDFAQAVPKTAPDIECRENMVLVYRENASRYVCVTDETAKRWVDLGIATLVEVEEKPAEKKEEKEAEMKEMDKETEKKEAEMKDAEKEVKEKDAMAKDDISMLFVQTAASGTFAEEDGSYILTLEGVSIQTIFFSDRPERVAGYMSTEDFVEEWGAGADSFAENPPNAAITIMSAADSENNIIVELTDPQYDSDAMTLQYAASVLEGDDNGEFFAANDGQIPAEFDNVSVFIDPSANASGHFCVWTVCFSGGVNAGANP